MLIHNRIFPGAMLSLILATVVGSYATAGEDPAQTYQQLFGEREQAVRATRDAGDDVALAKQILAGTRLDDIHPSLKSLLCEKAFDLAIADRQGNPVMEEILETWLDVAPESAVKIYTAKLDYLQTKMRYARGDARKDVAIEIYDTSLTLAQALEQEADPEAAQQVIIKTYRYAGYVGGDARKVLTDYRSRLHAAIRTRRELRRLVDQFMASPTAELAGEIARLYVVSFDAPQKAIVYSEAANDDALRRYVPLAAGELEDVKEADALGMGVWYKDLGDQAREDHEKAAMYSRAKRYLERFLDLHEASDTDKLKAQIMVKQLTAQLEKLGGELNNVRTRTLKVSDKITQNFKQWAPESEPNKAPIWRVDGEKLVGQVGNMDCYAGPALSLPIKTRGDYELSLNAAVDNKALVFFFPVGKNTARITYTATPASTLGGQSLRPRFTKSPGQEFQISAAATESGKPNKLTFKVAVKGDKVALQVMVNDQQALLWEGPEADVCPLQPRFGTMKSRFGISPLRNGSGWVSDIRAKGKVSALAE